ncbi:apoptosis-inducing factor 3-like isoform X2 [Gordionus sp. m RMFG-2023]|uniref:apoptosis-inducing factor 3-like isoform X2 n=1 Tax=Gordionus sp. m RMFG-2023 TaxID=3053472 RepID=UPI0031FCB2C1
MKEYPFEKDSKCTHYGAPLVNGVLNNGKIRCPWHGACFNTKTGDIEDFPGLDGLTCFNVEQINTDKYKISKLLKENIKFSIDIKNNKTLIIGSGPCGLECAETLRRENYDGNITLISKDDYLPYDRPKLSKSTDTSIDSIQLRKQEFFRENRIEVLLGKPIKVIDFAKKLIGFDDNTKLEYDNLMIATGSIPITSKAPGADLKNIFILRRYQDARNIFDQITLNKRVVIVGSSFIGMEVASALTGKVKSITVITKTDAPFATSFGPEIGNFIKNMHIQNGIYFETNVEIDEFGGGNNPEKTITHVSLSNGKILPCDICVLGLGVKPDNNLFRSPQDANNSLNLNLNQDGFIEVDEYMTTNIPNVFAGGDVVTFPLFLLDRSEKNRNVSIQHWQMATKHGQIAALNILKKRVVIKSVPYFWTVQFGKSFRYAGYSRGYDKIIIHQDDHKSKLVAFYMKDKIVRAVLTFMKDPVASLFAEIFLSGSKVVEHDVNLLKPLFAQDEIYVQGIKKFMGPEKISYL